MEQEKILQLRIELDEIKPAIWRSVLLEDTISFQELHDAIQTAMGWEDYHMFEFDIGNETITSSEKGHNLAEASFRKLHSMPEFTRMIEQQELSEDAAMLDANKINKLLTQAEKTEPASRFDTNTALRELVKKEGQQFSYLYDFGDNWEHTITVEKIMEKDTSQTYPSCIAGARACPPEDCGGVHGYEELMKLREDKKHPDYEERIVKWLGEEYDPEYFDVEEVNEWLSDGEEDEENEENEAELIKKAAKELTDAAFHELWKEQKDDLKELSKKELAEQMFFLGAVYSMYATREAMEHNLLAESEEEKYWDMPDDEKYDYLLTCEEEPDCEFSNFGIELEKKGEFEKAERLYKRELEVYPEAHWGNESLGRLYKKMGKVELAEQHLKNALELAMKQKEEDPNSIDDEVIDDLRKNLEEVKNAKH